MSTDSNSLPQRPPRSVRPMIIGLVIGLPLMAIVATVAAYYQSVAMKKASVAIEASSRFIMLVGSGQISDAKAMCTDQVTEQQLTDTTIAFEPWGAIIPEKMETHYGGKVHSDDDIEVQVLIQFEKAQKLFVGHWAYSKKVEAGSPGKSADLGSAKLIRYEFKDAPTTQPARK